MSGKTRAQYIEEIKLLQKNGASQEEINKLRGEYLNNAGKANNVAAELNQLKKQGASEEQISNFVTKSGYTEQDFNVDSTGTFRPMVERNVGKRVGIDYDRPTSAELAEDNRFYENLSASNNTLQNQSNTKTTTTTTTTTTDFQQVNGGGSTTTYRVPPKDTPTSLTARQDADRALNLQQAYQLDPTNNFDRNILNEQLTAGKLTGEQYNNIINSTPEQRDQKSLQYAQEYQAAKGRESAAQTQYDPVTVTTQAPNTSSITVTNETTVAVTTPVRDVASGTSTTTAATTPATYSSTTTTTNGIVVSAVLDNATNTITYTATAPNGVVVTSTQDTNTPGARELSSKLNAAGVTTGDSFLTSLNSAYTNVKNEATTATTAAESRGTAPPSLASPTPVVESAQTFPVEPQPIITSTPLVTSAQPLQVEVDTGLTDASGIPTENIATQEPDFVPVAKRVPLPQPVDTTLQTQSTGNEELLASEVNLAESIRAQNEARIRQIEENGERGILAQQGAAQSAATRQDVENAVASGDWRVRISLASKSDYFYNSPDAKGILAPLYETDGVVFPYTPTISVSYTANYDQQSLTHSNYKTTQYQGSSVDAINISGEFTAQDTYEANYLLATIHFFRTLTKMFYGQDQNPPRGTPPPLCYLWGYGEFQFNKHPLVITNFNYSLPADVDYIRAYTNSFTAGQPLYTQTKDKRGTAAQTTAALQGLVSDSGNAPVWRTNQTQPTYVPSKIQISITAAPVVARYDSSNLFSLRDYASGQLLRGSQQKWGGFW